MPIEVRNADVVVRLVRERLEQIKSRLPAVLEDAAAEIKLRTQNGLDVNGRPFAEYSPAYAKYRQKRGRNAEPVDLTFTGNMQAAIQVRVEDTQQGARGVIYFNSAREAAKARGNQERREFFGLSEEQKRRIVERLTRGS